ncbi:MAG: hypothetical protein ACREFD_18555 [Stellaceae bacterium]
MTIAKHLIFGAAAMALAGAGIVSLPAAIPPAYAACGPTAHVNGTTATSTQHLLKRHGYTNIKIDQKGCDNVWHVFANHNGHYGRYAVEPNGQIYPEGN